MTSYELLIQIRGEYYSLNLEKNCSKSNFLLSCLAKNSKGEGLIIMIKG
jgi:hypothetical protein